MNATVPTSLLGTSQRRSRPRPERSGSSPDPEKTASNKRGSNANSRWQAIEVRHLVALATVAREGSFRHAADQLGYVQSAISGQIAHLEHAVGMRLLDRASGTPTVELTSAGELLLRHTYEILARFETAHADISSLANRSSSAVRVAGLECFSPSRLARILSLFRQRHPFARVILEDPAEDDLEPALRRGSLDLLVDVGPAVDGSPAVHGSLVNEILEQDDYVLLVAAGSTLAARSKPLRATEIAPLRPIAPSSCAGSRELDAQLRELGLGEASVSSGSVATAQEFVACGLGAAIVPSQLISCGDPRIVTLDLSHLLRPHTIVLALDAEREHSAAIHGFINALRDVCRASQAAEEEASMEFAPAQHPRAA